MKKCEFPNCSFETKDDYETLDHKHIYCGCGRIIHFNFRDPIRQMGFCSHCNKYVEEIHRTKKIRYFKFDSRNRVIDCYEF